MTLPTTGFRRGDIVLVDFIFSDSSGSKQRPALVVSADTYQRSRQETIIAAITSNVNQSLFGDLVIADWQAAGLLFPSTVTGIIRTIKQPAVHRRLGSLVAGDLEAYRRVVRRSLELPMH